MPFTAYSRAASRTPKISMQMRPTADATRRQYSYIGRQTFRTDRVEIHRDAVDEIVEWLSRQREGRYQRRARVLGKWKGSPQATGRMRGRAPFAMTRARLRRWRVRPRLLHRRRHGRSPRRPRSHRAWPVAASGTRSRTMCLSPSGVHKEIREIGSNMGSRLSSDLPELPVNQPTEQPSTLSPSRPEASASGGGR